MRWGISMLRAPGRLAALGVMAIALTLRVIDLGIVEEPRLRIFDFFEWLWSSPTMLSPVVVVEIDEASLARYGQWPWPRGKVADLVRRIAQGRPLVLGIDIVFAEPDRLSPPEIARELTGLPRALAEQLAGLPASEPDLADALRAVPTVLALAPGRENEAAAPRMLHPAPIRQAGSEASAFLREYKSLLASLPELGAAAQGAGASVVEPDDDGIVRRVALAGSFRGTIIPAFALEVVRVGRAERSVVIDTGPHGIKNIRLGGLTIPTNKNSRAIPHFAPSPAQHLSAADVLDGRFNPADLKSKFVLLGVAGLAIGDQRQTPLGLLRGFDVNAQLVASILSGGLLQRPWYFDWIEFAMILAAGLIAIWLLHYDRPVRAAAFALAIVAGLMCLEMASFRFAGLLLDGSYAAATMLAAFGVMLIGILRAAEAELGRERAAKQRYEGELAAAQAIQMGLLPRRFPAFRNRPEIDLYARIEPARIVGGDLYDYILIDGERRLFFLIADVSGNGAPAALLMASTKEVIREAALKFGVALDDIFDEANRKTASASDDLQSEGGVFVTAFAGILDLASGNIVYANAGHEAPFIISGRKGLRQLVTEGGPPLGAIEGFSYPVDRDRIEPGEILLLYTDGVTEAEDADHRLYGVKRLERMLASLPVAEAQRLVAAVIDDLRRFIGEAEQADDITLMALRRVAGPVRPPGRQGAILP
jgi:adenylate cyclase